MYVGSNFSLYLVYIIALTWKCMNKYEWSLESLYNSSTASSDEGSGSLRCGSYARTAAEARDEVYYIA